MSESVGVYEEYVLWEINEGGLEYMELAVSDLGHLQIFIKERLTKQTDGAPSLEELEYIGKKPVVVCSKMNNYWMLLYKKGQAICFEQTNEVVQ